VTRITVIVCTLALSGCHVANRLYNPASPKAKGGGHRSIVRIAIPTPQEVQRRRAAVRHPEGIAIDTVDPDCDPGRSVCMAFVEFDERGELWDRVQQDEALHLIERARAAGHASGQPPIIVTFTHGWKNNAADGKVPNHNVVGFETILQDLHDGTFKDHPVVGVYLGWRGELIPEFWPVRRQFSYFNREAAAIRIPGASMTDLLTRIMIEGHRDDPDAQVLMIGHSFGGLVLERALTQAMTDYARRQQKGAADSADGARADLVVFVNSAAAATEGKQMLNLLKDFCYEADRATVCAAPGAGETAQPLFLSISSLGDAATRFAMPIGHGLSFLGFTLQGSWRDYRDFADAPAPPTVTAQSAFYMSTTAHMPALQSHVFVNAEEPNDLQRCAVDPATKQPKFYGPAFTTVTAETYRVCEKKDRWNDTPYWAMQMPATIVPDHSGIFNVNFVNLLTSVFLNPQVRAPRPQLKPRERAADTPR
jgi:hypothetical protein